MNFRILSTLSSTLFLIVIVTLSSTALAKAQTNKQTGERLHEESRRTSKDKHNHPVNPRYNIDARRKSKPLRSTVKASSVT